MSISKAINNVVLNCAVQNYETRLTNTKFLIKLDNRPIIFGYIIEKDKKYTTNLKMTPDIE